ncbi:GNAT family N-acetyltransferase [Haliovirga abyssi]|uniref:N-acetyltransferase domain-containing protein n=1 Tax=Haliovirga abyssi TaxID=2996794 RepID=A0AAU9DYB8_9FUSO|nr:GNAT family N-acetyltransferase [Haliovirga abyssi]BDU50420.1 hypothetical protein HLVA_09890 [Haliovirga abyssi]
MKKNWNYKSYKYRFLNFRDNGEEVEEFLKANHKYICWQDDLEIDEISSKDTFYPELPKGKRIEDKYLIGIYENKKIICIFDILKNFPEDETWMIGLMLLDENLRGKGLATELYNEIERYLIKHSVKKIRIGVLDKNSRGKAFWEKSGFKRVEGEKKYKEIKKVFIYEKIL